MPGPIRHGEPVGDLSKRAVPAGVCERALLDLIGDEPRALGARDDDRMFIYVGVDEHERWTRQRSGNEVTRRIADVHREMSLPGRADRRAVDHRDRLLIDPDELGVLVAT